MNSFKKIAPIIAVIASAIAILTGFIHLVTAYNSKADASEVSHIRSKVDRIEAVHEDETNRLDRIENKVDQLLLRRR